MSHFLTLVLLDHKQANDLEASIGRLLAPYDENAEVPAYDKPCSCVGDEARDRARAIADAECGTLDDLRESFRAAADKGWDEDTAEHRWHRHIAPYVACEKAAFESDPGKDAPKPTCGFYTERYCPDDAMVGARFEDGSGCGGTGTIRSTYNPKSKWDYWTIGGRWSGELGGRNTAPVSRLRADVKCFAIVTPDGLWHERGRMGWWAIVSDGTPKAEWAERVRGILSEHPDCLAVAVDCHI